MKIQFFSNSEKSFPLKFPSGMAKSNNKKFINYFSKKGQNSFVTTVYYSYRVCLPKEILKIDD